MIIAWIVSATNVLEGQAFCSSAYITFYTVARLSLVLTIVPPIINSSYSKPETQNVMLASHCKERYACEAFDYDDGRCNKAFFDTVCKTSASVGDKPSYPRRFSDMPGFEWFRD